MKARAGLLSFAILFAAAAVCVAADNVHLGTWKLDEAKSKISAGAPKNTTVVYGSRWRQRESYCGWR